MWIAILFHYSALSFWFSSFLYKCKLWNKTTDDIRYVAESWDWGRLTLCCCLWAYTGSRVSAWLPAPGTESQHKTLYLSILCTSVTVYFHYFILSQYLSNQVKHQNKIHIHQCLVHVLISLNKVYVLQQNKASTGTQHRLCLANILI